MRLLFDLDQAAAQLRALAGEPFAVEQDAGAFHLEQHRQHRHLDVAVHVFESGHRRDPREQRMVQPQGDVRVLGCVLGGAIDGDLIESDKLPRAFGLFYTLGSLCGIAAPLGYGLVGDIAGVENAIALIGIAVLMTLPLCAVLRSAVSAEPQRI